MKETVVYPWTATMTVGKMIGYSNEKISELFLRKSIAAFQLQRKKDGLISSVVKIQESEIIFEDYTEECWDITVINYPRFPLPTVQLSIFSKDLAKYLLKRLKQNRITICLPNEHWMIESENAEESHK
jgi:hypothetical protein